MCEIFDLRYSILCIPCREGMDRQMIATRDYCGQGWVPRCPAMPRPHKPTSASSLLCLRQSLWRRSPPDRRGFWKQIGNRQSLRLINRISIIRSSVAYSNPYWFNDVWDFRYSIFDLMLTLSGGDGPAKDRDARLLWSGVGPVMPRNASTPPNPPLPRRCSACASRFGGGLLPIGEVFGNRSEIENRYVL